MKKVTLIGMLAVFCLSIVAQATDKPHIVVILGDDHGVYHSTPYGATEIQTPHMQAMADEGITFSRAYVASPACNPSRTALFTGLMPSRNLVVGNHEERMLKPGLQNMAEPLIAAGYEVVFKGKVDHRQRDAKSMVPKSVIRLSGWNKPLNLTNVEDYIKKRKNPSKPLALFIGTVDTHTTWPKAETVRIKSNEVVLPPKTFDNSEARILMGRYVESVENVDRTIGEVRGLINKYLGKEKTIVLYTSDHGQNWIFGKWSLYETGVRTPLLAVWPDKIKPKSRTRAMVSWIDLFPTLIDIAGGTTPKGIDGRSFKQVLLGNTDSFRDNIFTIHKGDMGMNVYPSRAVRTEKWKYILNLHPEFYNTTHMDVPTRVGKDDTKNGHYFPNWGAWIKSAETSQEAAQFLHAYHTRPKEELYLVEKDPYEKNNLAYDPRYAEPLASLRAMIQARMEEVKDDKSLSGEPWLLKDHELPPAIKILYPNGGERLNRGDKAEVVWTAQWKGTSTVKLEYNDGSGWKDIAPSTPHDGSYTWDIPAITSPTVNLRVTSRDGKIFDESDENFYVSEATTDGHNNGGDREFDNKK